VSDSGFVWVVGQWKHSDPWEFQGVFDSEEKAVAACRDQWYFIWRTKVNEAMPHETCELGEVNKARYPLWPAD